VHTKSLLAVSLALAFAPLGCGRRDAPVPKDPAPAPTSADAIPAGPLSGKIAGEPFKVGNARYTIDTRPGYEKLELILTSAELKDPCGDLDPVRASSVWFRRKGAEQPKAETVHFGPKDTSDWEAHYDAWKDAHWIGNGTAAVLLSLHDLTADRKLAGEVSVCFGDVEGSCVAGTFSAQRCVIRVDKPVRGTSVLEPLPASAGSTTGAGENPPPG
jgi:hypothetical protein